MPNWRALHFRQFMLLYADILHEMNWQNLRGENLPNCILSAADAKRAIITNQLCADIRGNSRDGRPVEAHLAILVFSL